MEENVETAAGKTSRSSGLLAAFEQVASGFEEGAKVARANIERLDVQATVYERCALTIRNKVHELESANTKLTGGLPAKED